MLFVSFGNQSYFMWSMGIENIVCVSTLLNSFTTVGLL